MSTDSILKILAEHCEQVDMVGSRVTCSPPPTDTDQDILCLIGPDYFSGLLQVFGEMGCKFDGHEAYANALEEGSGFRSYRLRELNFILTTDREFHRRFLAAHSVAKHLNLLVKDDRIALFQAVLYGNAYAPEPEWC